MITDERLDQLIRGTLQWQAGVAASSQPSLSLAAHKLAGRLGPIGAMTRPTMSARPAARGGVSLITAILLIAALIGSAVLIGSAILREIAPTPIQPGPFGFATDCGFGPPPGVLLQVEVDGRRTSLHPDGVLAVDQSTPAETRAATIRGTAFGQRLLTREGVDLVLERLFEAGLTPGCRSIRTTAATGSITARLPQGRMQVAWAPGAGDFSLARLASPEEQASLVELVASVEVPESWLPADAWIDPVAKPVMPDQWLVVIGLLPTDYVPGDVLELPNGFTVDGSDPRYADVDLPEGQELKTLGSDMGLAGRFGPDSSERCAQFGTADALALAESLDAMNVGADGYGDLFSEDLSLAIGIDIVPVYPPGRDCAALAHELDQAPPPEATPAPSTNPDPVAGADPCDLLPLDAALEILGADASITEPSRVPLGVSDAQACGLYEALPDTGLPQGNLDTLPGRKVTVSLYPRGVSADAARALALGVFGHGSVESRLTGQPVWENECLAAGGGCARAMAAWSRPYLLFFEFDLSFDTGGPDSGVSPATAKDFVLATLEGLKD